VQNAVPAPAPADVKADASAPHGRAWSWVALVLVLVLAGVRFYRAPSDAAARLVVPDGEEYAVVAERFARLGRYDIEIEGKPYPPRYPPFFSVVLLSPVYRFAPGDIGTGIVAVFGFGLIAAAGAYAVGHRSADVWGGTLAALAVIFHPQLRQWARTIMTDLPAAAMFAVGLALFLRLRGGGGGRGRPSVLGYAAAGVVVATAAGLRAPAAALVIPFAVLAIAGARGVTWRRRAAHLAILLLPIAVLFVATAVYNHRTFGAWDRSGYHFWCPLPYDYPHLTFGFRYVFDTLRLLRDGTFAATLALGALALGALPIIGCRDARAVAAFAAATALPVSLFQTFYFHAEPRLHAPLLLLSCVAIGVVAAGLVPAAVHARAWAACAILVLALAAALLVSGRETESRNRGALDAIDRYLPDDGAIITNLTPVLLDPTVLRGTRRRWIGIDRRMAYADLAVADRPIDPRAVPMEWPGTKHRDPRLMAAGLRDVVAWTANERPDLLTDLIRTGTPTMLDAASIPPGSDPYKRLAEHFELAPVDPDGLLMKLMPREK